VLLYDNPISGNCFKVRLLFSLLGIEYERREVDVIDRSGRAELLGDLNPGLRVPTLVLDDGRPLAESDAILMYFAEGTEYLPEDRYARAQVLQWMFFEQYKHEPGIAVPRFWDTIATDDLTPPGDLEGRRASGREALKAMERHLRDREYFVGDRFTIADITLYAYTHVAPEGYQLEEGHEVKLTGDPRAAADEADALYTDVWVSMGDETEARKRRADLAPFQLDADLLAAAKERAIVLHCLPAHPGEEISADVLYGEHSAVWDQAENRLHAQKALLEMLLTE
jgi:glutathione S-transferase